MSVLDSRIIYLKESQFNLIQTGTPGIVYKIKDISNQPEYIWSGTKFITNLSFGKGEPVDFNGLYIQNTKFGDSANNTSFESNGVLVSTGTAATWQDIDFPIIIRTTGTNIPTLQPIQGNVTVPQWGVNDFNVCEGQELVHGWKEGSTMYWHCHVITNGTDVTDRYLK